MFQAVVPSALLMRCTRVRSLPVSLIPKEEGSRLPYTQPLAVLHCMGAFLQTAHTAPNGKLAFP